jgi:hypothetical protein
MDIRAAASLQMLATDLGNVRAVLEHAQALPVPAAAPVADHAEVILELSAAAQGLLSA